MSNNNSATARVSEMETTNSTIIKEAERVPGAPEYEISAVPIEFESTVDSQLITTPQLGEIVNGLFRPYFKDYVGCNIQFTTVKMPLPNATGMNGFVNPYQQHNVGFVEVPRFEVELYFQNEANAARASENAVKNIVPIGKEFAASKASSRSDALAAKIAGMNSRVTPGKNFTLSRETKDMLDKFYLACYRKQEVIETEVEKELQDGTKKKYKEKFKVSRPNWENGLIYEITDSSISNPNMYGVYVKVTNLDLITILREIWGKTNEDGHPVDYEIRAIRPLNTYGNIMPPNTLNALLKIDRLDCTHVNKMYKSLGMMTMMGTLPINRA